ncbi:MAG: substrate-binding domain-containing protein [Treponema sp.]|nr:substrate-binding domain-containing protein [Treponema sp.]
MKKLLLWACIVLVCFSFFACSGQGTSSGAAASDGVAKQRIAVSLPPANNSWQAKIRQVIDQAVLLHPDFEWTIKNAVDDDDQLNQLNIFLNDNYDAMIILPGNGTLLTPICERIYDSGCKTVILDRAIESSKYTALVMGDNYGCGVAAARLLGKLLNGQGDIVALHSYTGIPIDVQRFDGFKDTLTKEFPGIRILVEGDGEFNREAGLRAMTNILPGYPHIDAVYTQDDEAALGALTAINNARRDDIKYITGMGGAKEAYERFIAKDPIYVASMSYFPGQGADGVEMAVRILKGGTFPKDTVLGSVVVDSTNVHQFMNDAY